LSKYFLFLVIEEVHETVFKNQHIYQLSIHIDIHEEEDFQASLNDFSEFFKGKVIQISKQNVSTLKKISTILRV
jgi:hypothetical protein